VKAHSQPAGEHAGGLEGVLRTITQKTLIMGIGSDILCPLEEQRYMVRNLPDATLIEIDSAYGHDGFMVEGGKIAGHLRAWMDLF
jgi:homoserine O-acetyltransferase